METQNPTSTEAHGSDAEAALDADAVSSDVVSATEAGAIAASTAEGVATESTIAPLAVTEPKPSYVKLAMRNMVRKRGLSLWHFTLTTIGLLVFLVGLSYVTR